MCVHPCWLPGRRSGPGQSCRENIKATKYKNKMVLRYELWVARITSKPNFPPSCLLQCSVSPRPVYPDGEEGVVHHHGEAEDSGQAAHQGQEQYGPEGGRKWQIWQALCTQLTQDLGHKVSFKCHESFKNPEYGRHWLSRRVRIIAMCQKTNQNIWVPFGTLPRF